MRGDSLGGAARQVVGRGLICSPQPIGWVCDNTTIASARQATAFKFIFGSSMLNLINFFVCLATSMIHSLQQLYNVGQYRDLTIVLFFSLIYRVCVASPRFAEHL